MIHVDCTDGDERDLTPERFVLAERTLDVESILDRWFGASYTYFKVHASDGHTYILKHDRAGDTWDLLFTETYAPEPPPPTWPFSRPSETGPH